MVVLSVAIVTKKGQPLIARQYVSMSKMRIEELICSFTHLVAQDESNSKQHTFVDSNDIRYIYHSMETFHLLLITNLQSNIINDITTLRLIEKLISNYCNGKGEKGICENGFELICAIDEVLSPLGYQEQIDCDQIKKYTKMQSVNAQCVELEEQTKIESAKQIAKNKCKQIEEKRKYQKQLDLYKTKSFKISNNNNNNNSKQSKLKTPKMLYKKTGNDGVGVRHVGFELKSKKHENDKMVNQQSNIDKSYFGKSLLNTRSQINGGNDFGAPDNTAVEINFIEKLNALLDCDGVISKFDVKGEMEIKINENTAKSCVFEIVKPNKMEGFGKINYRPHPHIDTLAFKNNNILMVKDESKTYKTGNNATTNILKWCMSCNDEYMIPICLNYWPQSCDSDNKVTVSVTYNVERKNIQLNNVVVSLPAPSCDDEQPDIIVCDGKYTFCQRENKLEWNLGDLQSGDEGQFEYTLNNVELKDLCSLSIDFEMSETYLPIQVRKVWSRTNEDEEFEFSVKQSCNVDKYIVGEL